MPSYNIEQHQAAEKEIESNSNIKMLSQRTVPSLLQRMLRIQVAVCHKPLLRIFFHDVLGLFHSQTLRRKKVDDIKYKKHACITLRTRFKE